LSAHLIRKNSWHLRLITHYTAIEKHEIKRDSFGYIKQVALGGFLLVLYLAIFYLLSFCYVDLLFWCIFDFGNWEVLNHQPAAFAAIVITVIAILIAIEKIKQIKRDRRTAYMLHSGGTPPPEPEPGFLTMAYRSLKDRYCVKIVLEEDLEEERELRNSELQ